MKQFKRKKQKRTKSRKRKHKKKQVKAYTQSIPTFADYFGDILFEDIEEWSIPHPNQELWFRRTVETVCGKSLSTQTLEFLDELYQKSNDVVMRGLLARQIHLLRYEYLQSFKEYSDRALILLAEREKLFDKWEGIYILGCFGGSRALAYLRKQLNKEKEQLLLQTIKRAVDKIEKNTAIQTLEQRF